MTDKQIINVDRIEEIFAKIPGPGDAEFDRAFDQAFRVIESQLVADLTRIENTEDARSVVDSAIRALYQAHQLKAGTIDDHGYLTHTPDSRVTDGAPGVSGGRAEAGGTGVGNE